MVMVVLNLDGLSSVMCSRFSVSMDLERVERGLHSGMQRLRSDLELMSKSFQSLVSIHWMDSVMQVHAMLQLLLHTAAIRPVHFPLHRFILFHLESEQSSKTCDDVSCFMGLIVRLWC